MKWHKRYILRPLYLVMYWASILILIGGYVTAIVCFGKGYGLGQVYAIVKPLATAYCALFFASYYLKWEYVYGPQKHQELKDETNG